MQAELRVLHEGRDLVLGDVGVVVAVLFEVSLELGLLLGLLPRLLVVDVGEEVLDVVTRKLARVVE